ncbi:MAG: hypothetical protein IJ060_11690 [Oscillospiraceae bacterium]|nr:hypothetical protein [Oscillospiraceae bacterium]
MKHLTCMSMILAMSLTAGILTANAPVLCAEAETVTASGTCGNAAV